MAPRGGDGFGLIGSVDRPDWDLIAKIKEIDLRDGKLDGKPGVSPQECPGCGKPNGPHRKACLYCGGELPAVSPL